MSDDVAGRLLVERQRIGLSQADFADAGGVAYGTYLNYEKGRRSPDAEFLSSVASRGVDVLYVITGRRDTGTLSSDEEGLVGHYRLLPSHQRAALVQLVQSLAGVTPTVDKSEG